MQDKSRLTVLLGANATGTHKLRPLVIGHARRPRAFGRINISSLPVTYHFNSKAWMRSDIWISWLKSIDALFRARNQKVLLLVDNAPSHVVTLADSSLQADCGEEDSVSSEHSETDNENQTLNSNLQSQKRRQSQKQGQARSGTSKRARQDEAATNQDSLMLTHVAVQYLPPNTTAHIQPMDAGIIKSFKAKYKHLYCQHILQMFEEKKDIEK